MKRAMPRIALAALVGGAPVFGSAPAAHAMAQATADSCSIALTDTHLDESHNVRVSSNGSRTSPSQFDSVVVELAFSQTGSRVACTQTAVIRWAANAGDDRDAVHARDVELGGDGVGRLPHGETSGDCDRGEVSESEDFPTTFSCK